MTVKHDAGKPRPGLVLNTMSRAIQAVVDVAEHGARKYSPDNWLTVPDAQHRYTDAMLRHLLAEQTGQSKDPDSGLLHAAHAAWGALARLDLMLRKQEQVKVPPASIQPGWRATGGSTAAFSAPVYETKYDWAKQFKGFGQDAAAVDAARARYDCPPIDAAEPVRLQNIPPLLNWPQQLVSWLRRYSKAFGPLADRGLLIAQYCTNTRDMRVIGSKTGRYSGLLAIVNAVPSDSGAVDSMQALGLAVDEAVKHWDKIHAESAYVGFVLDAERKATAERAKRRDEREKLNAENARVMRLMQSPNRVAMAALKHQLAQSLELNKLAKPLERLRRAGRLVAEVKGEALWLRVLDPGNAELLVVGEAIREATTREQEQEAIRKAVAEAYRRMVTMPGLERYITPTPYRRDR